MPTRKIFEGWWHRALLFILVLFILRQVKGQIDCNNCGNNCGACKLQFPDPPPIILQPPAPPPNNTCCDNVGAGNNAFTGNYGGCGSNCGTVGDYAGSACCNDCYGCQNTQQTPIIHQQPNIPGGPLSRTNRCCQVICTKCGNCGCCQPCCGCCQPCCDCCGVGNNADASCCCCPQYGCLCNSCCAPSCSCCDCCNDCYSSDYDCEIGYKKRRKRQVFHHPVAFHRIRTPFQRRFYVLPLPLPPSQGDVPPRTKTHHHFHHHFVHCCGDSMCGCCCCGCPQQNTCFGSNCNRNMPTESMPYGNMFGQPQTDFYGRQQFGTIGNGFPYNTNSGFNNYNGFFRHPYGVNKRRRRQTVLPSYGSSDKVINFLIPMFYKKATTSTTPSPNKCVPKRNTRSFPCPQPIVPPTNNDHKKHPNQFYQPCTKQEPLTNAETEAKRCCCCCVVNCVQKKKRKRRKRKR